MCPGPKIVTSVYFILGKYLLRTRLGFVEMLLSFLRKKLKETVKTYKTFIFTASNNSAVLIKLFMP